MIGLTRSPLISRGALVAIDPTGPPRAVAFQYNPDEMTRTLQARTAASAAGPGPATNEALGLSGAPIETHHGGRRDRRRRPARGRPAGHPARVYPQLSALEMLVYPSTTVVVTNTALALSGSIELVAPEAPLTLQFWRICDAHPVIHPDELVATDRIGSGLRIPVPQP